VYDFSEGEGQLLSWAAFFGHRCLPRPRSNCEPQTFQWPQSHRLSALRFVRPLGHLISLSLGCRIRLPDCYRLRFARGGLATASLRYWWSKSSLLRLGDFVLHFAINTVWISALLHGVTAVPMAKSLRAHPENEDIAAVAFIGKLIFVYGLAPSFIASKKGLREGLIQCSSVRPILIFEKSNHSLESVHVYNCGLYQQCWHQWIKQTTL